MHERKVTKKALKEVKDALIEAAGADVVAKLTDANIRQFEKILFTCAKIIYERSKREETYRCEMCGQPHPVSTPSNYCPSHDRLIRHKVDNH